MIGSAWNIQLLSGEKAKLSVEQVEAPAEEIYQLGRWDREQQMWQLLPSVGRTVEGNLLFTITATGEQSDLYQLFLTPRSMIEFIDLQNHWGREYMRDLAIEGVFQGYSDGTIRPDRSITRAEFVVLLERVFADVLPVSDEQASEQAVSFQDEIPQWAAPAVDLASRLEIVRGYEDGTFRPQQEINRTEMAVMIGRAIELVEQRTSPLPESAMPPQFLDENDIAEWGKDFVDDMRKRGLLTGNEGYFHPNSFSTRAETAVVFWRYLAEKDF